MTLQTPIEPVGDDASFTAAIAGVNAWRGACMQCFAQAEAATTETLLVLHRRAGSRSGKVRLRHLVGQRLADLAEVIGPDGPFEAEGKPAYLALQGFRELEHLRTLVGHSVAKVALDRKGQWIVLLRHLSIRAKTEERSTSAIEQVEAEELLGDLRKRSRRLCAQLERLQKIGGLRA